MYWRLPQASAGGLEVWWADFMGHRILWRGSQPFALVPYHGRSPTFKDGFDAKCGGAPFDALNHNAPNMWNTSPGAFANKDTDAVKTEVEPSSDIGPAVLRISAKFQCGWYQYVHSWEFDSDGVITPHVAMGGQLMPGDSGRAHVHHMYYRIDLDVDGQFPHDVIEEFEHKNLDPGADAWTVLKKQGKRLTNPDSARKWRVRNTISKNDFSQWKGYEIELPRVAGRDEYSTGDLWATIYRGDATQQGEGVGANCTDKELESVYANGPLDTNNGSDIVLWVVSRAHHEPRNDGEEHDHLPYHYEEFHIVPRNFARLRGGGHD